MYEPTLFGQQGSAKKLQLQGEKRHDPSASSVEIQQACTHSIFRSLDAVFQVTLLSGTGDFLFARGVSKQIVFMCCLYHVHLNGDISVGKNLAFRKGKICLAANAYFSCSETQCGHRCACVPGVLDAADCMQDSL